MAFVFIDPRRHKLRKRRIIKSVESERVLAALDTYLEGNYQEPMKWLVRFWRDQATVMTYQELRRIVTDEDEPERLFDTWYQDYSKVLNKKMTPVWESAFMAGANSNPALAGVEIDNSDVFVRDWIVNHTGNLITSVTEDQVNAVRYIIAESKAVRMGSEETARYIRPTIGLTERQAQANLKHYTSVKEQLQEDHPRMRPENIERKARESAARYAQKQQMYRAETISRTEIAQAYNQGNDVLIKQAMEQGLIPIQKKVWSTAMDGHVCEACEALEGTEIDMNGEFSVTVGVKVRRTMTTALPPMHPRCKCAVMYESTGEYMTPVESPVEQENTIENPITYDTMETRNMANGLRRSPLHELDEEEITSVKKDAESIGIPFDILSFNTGNQTGFSDFEEIIHVRGDILPDVDSITPRDRMSQRAVLAHEYYGHFKAHPSDFRVGDWRDEFRASYRAAIDTPNLTDDERRDLMLDAFDRAKEAGVPVQYNSMARRIIYGYE